MKQRTIAISMAALAATILCVMVIPRLIICYFGCWQIGSWIGKLTKEKIDNQ
jgi:hypothetical protein